MKDLCLGLASARHQLELVVMKRALRRHHVARLKRSRRFHWGRDLAQEPKPLAKAVDTPCPCSCWMCGNPRRYFGELTPQERRELLGFREWQSRRWP